MNWFILGDTTNATFGVEQTPTCLKLDMEILILDKVVAIQEPYAILNLKGALQHVGYDSNIVSNY